MCTRATKRSLQLATLKTTLAGRRSEKERPVNTLNADQPRWNVARGRRERKAVTRAIAVAYGRGRTSEERKGGREKTTKTRETRNHRRRREQAGLREAQQQRQWWQQRRR